MHGINKQRENNFKASSSNIDNSFQSCIFNLSFFHSRVKVLSFTSNETISVRKFDYGDTVELDINALRLLPPSYRKLPQMVFRARLHGKKIISLVFMDAS